VQRQLLVLEQQGGDKFFGEPALNVKDFLRTTSGGKGYVNILSAEKLTNSPRLYATFLLWMLSELFEELPEVGDLDKPKLVFFFDEAHLLFSEAPSALLEKIEQVVRLIRSKGVGVYFATQNPADVPEKVATQLGNSVQHALRAFTPRDQKAVKAAAETFRQNPEIDCETVITELGKGEALVSMLEGNGTPSIVQVTKIRPPSSRLGPLTLPERQQIIDSSPLQGQYEDLSDRESAYEVLQARSEGRVASAQPQQEAANSGGFWGSILGGATGSRGGHRQGVGEAVAKGVVRTISTTVGRQIGAAVLGAVIGKAVGRRSGGGAIAGSIARNVGASVTRNVTGSIMRGVLGSLSR
jgi:DNA helicase HerA-like ATPase